VAKVRGRPQFQPDQPMIRMLLGRVLYDRYTILKSPAGHYYVVDAELENGTFTRMPHINAVRLKGAGGKGVTVKAEAERIVGDMNADWIQRVRSYVLQALMLQ
jgi:hypothetical protein